MRRVDFRPEATTDLAEIWNFTAGRWGVGQAETYTRGLIASLEALPHASPKARPCDEIHINLWRLRQGAHIVFFFSDPSKVVVVRILHERMDHVTQLRDIVADEGPADDG